MMNGFLCVLFLSMKGNLTGSFFFRRLLLLEGSANRVLCVLKERTTACISKDARPSCNMQHIHPYRRSWSHTVHNTVTFCFPSSGLISFLLLLFHPDDLLLQRIGRISWMDCHPADDYF